MTDLSRREALAAAAITAALTTLPTWAQTAPASAAAWDLTEIYPDDAAWDAARKKALADLPSLAAYRGKLGAQLGPALIASSDLERTVQRIYTYASLKADEDLRVSATQAKKAQATDLATAYGEATAWMRPELIALGKDRIEAALAAAPALRPRFDFFLRKVIDTAPHTLTADEEALLAATGAPFAGSSDIRNQLVSADIPWPTVTLSDGKRMRLDDQGYTLVRDAAARPDRKLVFDTFWHAYGQYEHSLGAAYQARIKADIFTAKARKYPTSLAAALAPNAVPEAVYRSLVAETNAGLPQLHRYFELRRRLLKLPDMAYYDIYPPLVQLDRTFTLPEMRAVTIEAVKPLGPEYGAIFAKSTAARWMDPSPRAGKASGAYMNPGAYDVHPYLLLNLSDHYDGLTTYAHEWGHAMHSLLAAKAQPYDKANYPIFTAEIASTCNEQLLVAYMVARAKTKEEKLFYLGQQLENLRGTFFRQAMFAEFELAAHDKAEAGEGLTGERFTALYVDLLRRYHGPKVTIDPAYAIEWAYIPHFYRGFYVYQYATSVSAASYFARSILKGGAKERDTYLGVLKAGGSDYPVAILQRAGLDMASPAPYRALVQTFKETLDQAEALMG